MGYHHFDSDRSQPVLTLMSRLRVWVALTLMVVATGVLVAACASSAGPLRSVLEPGATPMPAEARLDVIEWARLAQNAHNYQSWRIVLDDERDDRFSVFVEERRLLPQTDPFSRQIVISVGTFLAVVDARAAQLGYRADIELLPDGDLDLALIGSRSAALVTLVPDRAARSRYAAAADHDAITAATVKYRYHPAQIDDALVARVESYATDQVRIEIVSDPEAVAWLNDLSLRAFTIEMEHEPTLMETYASSRMNGRARRESPYGLAFTANFPKRSLWFMDAMMTIAPQRPAAFARTGIRLYERALDQITTYVVVSTAGNYRRTQIEVGLALQALWMELHASGHVVLANSQALQEYPEMAELYDEVHRRLASDGATVQMLLAVACPAPGAHRFSPRIAAVDLIDPRGQ
ncbi:MAG: hypothetical protein EA382_04615 [Spirochaetaceae bacterium]|nr:MAG: hypothetical protein EA382_04615 [Spirochaetaceae bacterium]